MEVWKLGFGEFLFRNNTAVHCLRWRKAIIAIKRIEHLVRYCTSNDRASEFQVNLRIYRFGTLGLPALAKQAKFADQRDFLLSSGFPAEWGNNGRYQVLWIERSHRMLTLQGKQRVIAFLLVRQKTALTIK